MYDYFFLSEFCTYRTCRVPVEEVARQPARRRPQELGAGHLRVRVADYIETGAATMMADVYSFSVVVLEVLTGAMAVDARSPEVLMVRKVHQQCQDQQDRRHVDAEALVDRRQDGRFDRQEVARMARIGIACTRSDPAARPSMRKIVSILDGNDEMLEKLERRSENREVWETKNAPNLSLVRRLQALGIH